MSVSQKAIFHLWSRSTRDFFFFYLFNTAKHSMWLTEKLGSANKPMGGALSRLTDTASRQAQFTFHLLVASLNGQSSH